MGVLSGSCLMFSLSLRSLNWEKVWERNLHVINKVLHSRKAPLFQVKTGDVWSRSISY